MDYLNAIVSSPKTLYTALDDHECDKEILEFVKKNKSFTMKLLHIYIVLTLQGADVKDAQMIYVTNYIKNPDATVATNAQEKGIETSMMRGMPAFLVYEAYTKPGGLKDKVEEMFHTLVE